MVEIRKKWVPLSGRGLMLARSTGTSGTLMAVCSFIWVLVTQLCALCGNSSSCLHVCNAFIREGNGTPLQYSYLANPMDRGAWWAAVHGVRKSQTQLSDFTFTFHFHALEKEMATHSSVLAWRIPGTGEPGGLPSMGSHRVGHDWSNLATAAAAAAAASHWKSKK